MNLIECRKGGKGELGMPGIRYRCGVCKKRCARFVAIIGLVAIMTFAMLACLACSRESSGTNEKVVVPSIENVEEEIDGIGGIEIAFSKASEDREMYRIILNGSEIGSLCLSAGMGADIDVAVERDNPNAQEVFEKTCIGAMVASDGSLNFDSAKELLDVVRNEGDVHRENAEYFWDTNSSNYLRLQVWISGETESK